MMKKTNGLKTIFSKILNKKQEYQQEYQQLVVLLNNQIHSHKFLNNQLCNNQQSNNQLINNQIISKNNNNHKVLINLMNTNSNELNYRE